MMLTIEMSMYPFRENHRPVIGAFIDQLNTYTDLKITTTHTATMVVGELQAVMKMLTDMLEWSSRTQGRAVFVTKFIPDYSPDESKPAHTPASQRSA